MNELVKIENNIIGGDAVNSVNARELWEFLESKQQFADWIKSRLDDIGAVEGEDFLTLHKKMNRQILKDYIVTLDIAKHIGMLERNAKGRQIRQYFIDFEKSQNGMIPKLPQNYKEALIELVSKVEEIEHLHNKVEADKPKVSLAESIEVGAGAMNISDWVRVLKEENIKIKQTAVFNLLREWKILQKEKNIPYAKYLDNGWFEVTEYTIITPKGSRTKNQTKITGKGQVELSYKIKQHFKNGSKPMEVASA